MSALRLSCTFASSSRITLHHLPLPPLSFPLARYGSSLATRTPEPASAGFEGISPAYTGPVKTALSDTKTKIDPFGKKVEVDPHAAPPPPPPQSAKLAQPLSGAASAEFGSGSLISGSGVGAGAPKRKVPLKGKKNAITITPAAISHLQKLLSSSSDPKLLRIGVKSRGCAGMAYHLEYVSPPGGRFDEVVEQDGVKVLIDSKALFSIIGSKMDWRDTRLSAGFVFDNPNVVDTCGCGESFNIRM